MSAIRGYLCFIIRPIHMQARVLPSKTPLRVRHTSNRQLHERRILLFEQDLWYGDSGSQAVLKTECSNFQTMA
jgi:hypothetical protein